VILASRYGSVADSLVSAAGDFVQIVPTSVGVTGTSGTINSNGTVILNSVTYFAINGCFSSTYRNYFVQIEWQWTFAGSTSTNWRLRKAGVDRTNANGYWEWLYESGGRGAMQTATNTNAGFVPFAGNNLRNAFHMTFFNPFDNTGATGGCFVRNRMATTFSSGRPAEVHDTASICNGGSDTHDGFSFGSWSNALSGQVAIYGFKD
jgi:hypothetical protein